MLDTVSYGHVGERQHGAKATKSPISIASETPQDIALNNATRHCDEVATQTQTTA